MRNLEKALRILEFDKIREMLASLAQTQGAKKRALSLTPSSNSLTVERRQELTNNAKEMAEAKGSPSFNSIPDILDTVEKAQKNSILSPREILDVAISLQTARTRELQPASGTFLNKELKNKKIPTVVVGIFIYSVIKRQRQANALQEDQRRRRE